LASNSSDSGRATEKSEETKALPVASERRALALLTASIFASSIGTSLLLVDISVIYLQQTGSAILSSLVYVAQYLPIVFLASVAAWLCDRLSPRTLLVTVELVTLVITIGIGALFGRSYILVFALMLARGFLDVVMKSGRGVAAKIYLPPATLERGNNILNGGYYIGSGAGGLLGIAIIDHLTVFEISLVDAGTFLLSAALYAGLVPLRVLERSLGRGGAWRRTMTALARDTRLGREFTYLVLSVALMEGINPVLRVWIPVNWLGLPASGAALTQTIGLVAIAVGLAAATAWLSNDRRDTIHPGLLMALSVISLLGIVASRLPVAVFAAYFGYFAFYEMLYTKCLNGMLVSARTVDMPYLMAAFYGASFGGVIIVVLLTSVLTDKFGLPPMLAGLAIVSCAVMIPVEIAIRRRQKHERHVARNLGADNVALDDRRA
jgi:MFS family permease